MTDHDNTLDAGIEAIQRGDKTTARSIFRNVLASEPNNIQALLWLAGLADSRAEKDRVLQHVLRIDPDNAVARRGLEVLSAETEPPAATSAIPASPTPAPTERTPASNPGVAATQAQRDAAEPSGTPPERDTLVLGAASTQRSTRKRRRRGAAAWLLPALAALVVCGVGGLFVAQQTNWLSSLTGQRAASTATAVAGSAATTSTATAVAATQLNPVLGASPAVSSGAALTSTTTINIPGVQAGGSMSPSAGGTAASTAMPSAGAAAPSVEGALPSVPASPAPLVVPAPTLAANGVPRPTVIDPKQHSTAGTWRWSYYGLSNVSTGRGYSAPPANGRFLIVLLVVQNLGTTPQQIPDGLYVVTDDQGRSFAFNRQASAEYFRQAGVVADYPPTVAIPPTSSWVSVPVLFDVPPDATNLIVSSTSNPAQGYLVRKNMQR